METCIRMVFLVLFVNVCMVHSIILDEIVQSYIQNVLRVFERDVQNQWFDHTIQPPLWHRSAGSEEDSPVRQRHYLLPKVFVWAPAEHFQLELRCPKHGIVMTGAQWTNVVNKKSYLNPRLVYDVGGNIILVQRYYRCTYNGVDQCRYLSGSAVIMECLPNSISTLFPFKIYHRSSCTKDLLNLVETLVLEGNNFLQMSEIIANLNYREFSGRNSRYLLYLTSTKNSSAPNGTKEKLFTFYEDLIFSFPSDSQLIRMYLDRFNEMKLFYRQEMEKVGATSLALDHTFKISKNIGCYRDTDGRYIKQFGFLLVLLNENNEIVDWRLTRSAGYSEVKDLLQDVKNRKGVNVESVHVDNCCQSRKQIQEIMGNVPVKLDLFHAIQRVTSVIPKGTEFSKAFCKEFSLVFRQDEDLGENRMLKTPEVSVITKSLDSFCKRWETVLACEEFGKLAHEIEKVRRHIDNGCLSGIQSGSGTAGNERVHRSLNRSLLCGTSVVGPELAIAILTVLFHHLNSKRKGEKHLKNARVVPAIPIHIHQSEHEQKDKIGNGNSLNTLQKAHAGGDNENSEASTEISSSTLCGDPEDVLIMADDIEHLLSDAITKRVIHTSNQIYGVLEYISSSIDNKSCRSVNFWDVPFMQMHHQNTLTCDTESTTDISNNHHFNLTRNLASFGLSVDPVSGDGDCVFTSIIRQLSKLPKVVDKDPLLRAHLVSLGLGGSEEADAYTLRQIFVNHVQTNEFYQMVSGVSSDRLNEETELFRERGTFCGNLGDLVVRVCADVLRMPIVVITSLSSFPYTSFIPDSVVVTTPLYLAYDATACGHYDATRQKDSQILTGSNSCSCGKNAKGEKASCLSSGRKACPCVRRGVYCTRKCICKSCCNVDSNTAEKSILKNPSSNLTCRCGQHIARNNKNGNYVSCKDGKTKSRCPCLGNGQGCSTLCRCVYCANVHGTRPSSLKSCSGVKRKRSEGIYRRVKGSQFLSSVGISQTQGPWTNYESMLLLSTIKIISLSDVTPSADNISRLFNFVVSSSLAPLMPITPSPKTACQIAAKLAHFERKRQVACARLPSE